MTCKLMTAYEILNSSKPYTWVKFPDGSQRANTNLPDIVLTLEKVNDRWVGFTNEHEPDDVDVSAKSLVMAKKKMNEWAKDYEVNYYNYSE